MGWRLKMEKLWIAWDEEEEEAEEEEDWEDE